MLTANASRSGHFTKQRAVLFFLHAMLLSFGCTPSPISEPAAWNRPDTTSPECNINIESAEFQTGKDGRPLLIPLVWNGKTFTFLLDTGTSRTTFDTSLTSELGKPIGRTTARTTTGTIGTDLFLCPDVTVDGLPLSSLESIAVVDLQPLRQATAEDIRGILGADFLQRFVVSIDFDQGLVQFHESLTSQINVEETWLPMQVDPSGRPHVIATIGQQGKEMVLLDTGATGGGTVRAELFDRLVDRGEIASCNNEIGLTAGGSFTQSSGYLSILQVDRFRPDSPRVARHFESSVGLDWLSRFQVAIDFPNRRVMLKRGNRFDERFSKATSGFVIIDMGGRKFVTQIRPNSPASAAGLSEGDEVLRIGKEQSYRMDMFTVRKLLTEKVGKVVDLTIRRGSSEFSTSIELVDRMK